MLSPTLRWLLQRIALLDSPLLMIAAIASLFTDRALLGAALALFSFALFMLGRPSLGQRHPPGDPRSEERARGFADDRPTRPKPTRERSRRRRTPL